MKRSRFMDEQIIGVFAGARGGREDDATCDRLRNLTSSADRMLLHPSPTA